MGIRTIGSLVIAIGVLAASVTAANAENVGYQAGRYGALSGISSISFTIRDDIVRKLRVAMPMTCTEIATNAHTPEMFVVSAGKHDSYAELPVADVPGNTTGLLSVEFTAEDESNAEVELTLDFSGSSAKARVTVIRQSEVELCSGTKRFNLRRLNS